MGNALFVVWRESLEALLIVGILHAWLRENDTFGGGRRALWIGVAGGIAAALLLAWTMVSVQDALSGEALEWFQIGMLFLAAGLITQMVLWMQKHGRHMKRNLQNNIALAAERSGRIGIALIALLAIAREGAETVVFLYGLGLEGEIGALIQGAVLGLLLAFATAWLLARGLRFLSYAAFFRVTGFLLLMFAAALLTAGLERAIGMGWLPALVDPVWDSSALLDDGGGAGKLAAALTGYRARPALLLLIGYLGYWLLVIGLQRNRRTMVA